MLHTIENCTNKKNRTAFVAVELV